MQHWWSLWFCHNLKSFFFPQNSKITTVFYSFLSMIDEFKRHADVKEGTYDRQEEERKLLACSTWLSSCRRSFTVKEKNPLNQSRFEIYCISSAREKERCASGNTLHNKWNGESFQLKISAGKKPEKITRVPSDLFFLFTFLKVFSALSLKSHQCVHACLCIDVMYSLPLSFSDLWNTT